jgi:hypothetical protein
MMTRSKNCDPAISLSQLDITSVQEAFDLLLRIFIVGARQVDGRQTCPFSMTYARYDILTSRDHGTYSRREGRFPVPIWLIAEIIGMGKFVTSGRHHLLRTRVSCRLLDTEEGCR